MSWNLRKTLQFFGIIVFAFVIAFLQSYLTKSATVEASQIEKTWPRLQLQTSGEFYNGGFRTNILVVCDTANGNLIYAIGPGSDGGIAVITNNCHKNSPR